MPKKRNPNTTRKADATRVDQAPASVSPTPSLQQEFFPDFYGNVVKANVTPYDLNLIFGRAAIPANAPDKMEIRLVDHISTVVRVAVPIASLPSIVRLLQHELEIAQGRGFLQAPSSAGRQKKREAGK